MSTDEKRVILWCLGSEIEAFNSELARRGGPRRDHYGNPVHDTVVAHLRLLDAARDSVTRIKVE